MKALSLTQPWAWLVIYGGKAIENRTWRTDFRGRFLVHASKGMTRGQYHDALALAHRVDGTAARRLPRMGELLRGGIVGVAELVDVLEPTDEPTVPWHMPGQYGFVLRNVRPLPFTPCPGALGFWRAAVEVRP